MNQETADVMNIEQVCLERFWEKVDVKGENECWEWLAGKRGHGYGGFWFNGRIWRSHRFSWFLHNGIIPEGLGVCHHCDNPLCVNPAHLFIGTVKDNMQDAKRKGRTARQKGESHGRSILTEKQVLALRKEHESMIVKNISALAKKYNVGYTTAYNIVTRKRWRHI